MLLLPTHIIFMLVFRECHEIVVGIASFLLKQIVVLVGQMYSVS